MLFHVSFENSLAHVESTHGIDLDHGSEAIYTQFLGTGKEIASSTIDKNINSTELGENLVDACFAGFRLADITLDANTSSILTQLFGDSSVLLSLATEQNDSFCTMLQVSLSALSEHTTVATSGNNANLALHELRVVKLG